MASANTSRVRVITTFNQFESAMSDTNSVVVILYTAPGCPHCNRFLPQYNSISIEPAWNNISFYNVNIMSGDGLGIARRNNVAGVPHTSFYSRAKKLGDMRGDSVSEFRKLLAKHLQDRTFVGAGYVLGSSGNAEPPRAMGSSREENANKLEKKSVPAHKIEALEGMGFDRSKAIAALQRTDGDVDQAADMLLGGGSAQDKAWIAGISIDTAESDAQRRQQELGRKCGIGLGLVDHWDNTGPRVSDIVPYSPAAEAKIFNKGDKIIAIDGVDVRGFRVDQLKNLILGTPGTQVEISFVPVSHLRWGGGLLGGNEAKDIVKIILTREVRLDTCLAGARAKEVKTEKKQMEEPAQKPAWYTTVWQDIKAGSERMTKNLETGFKSAGDKIEEAGSAIGKSASNGWEKTSKGAKEVAKSINESTTSASETMTEAGEKLKEAVVVDTAARKRIAELEEENRILREKLGQAASSGSNTPSAQSDSSRRASFRYDDDAKPSAQLGGDGGRNGESTDIRSYTAETFSTAKSPNVSECSIRVRMTDGTVVEKSFPSTTKLKAVVESVLPSDDLREEWTLMLPYPRKIFCDEDLDQTLLEASLAPAATMNVTKRK
uniref:UBX domain-containing protein n=1 Tax=Hanusia phi TaxID=3032 RepID=A0A7S0EUU0_9CRYP|mmetsp:Transcript_32257/g.72472  ORF Transcript_32257/g.72472 Transcript_32257/m.72472 type:complete len:605 (+) Transcript_32257:221-2035(+)